MAVGRSLKELPHKPLWLASEQEHPTVLYLCKVVLKSTVSIIAMYVQGQNAPYSQTCFHPTPTLAGMASEAPFKTADAELRHKKHLTQVFAEAQGPAGGARARREPANCSGCSSSPGCGSSSLPMAQATTYTGKGSATPGPPFLLLPFYLLPIFYYTKK